jgi:hypothetical protein
MDKEIGHLVETLFEYKNRKTALNAEVTELNGYIRETELKLLDKMKDENLDKLSSKTYGTVYIATQTVPKVINWDAFYKYIQENGAFEMLERRASRKAFQESYEQGIIIPGVDPVVFDEVRTRKN